MYTHSVSSLNEQIKSLLEESFNPVLVEGELSRITFHNSGHIYFSLKDSASTLKAVMFRGNASKLKFQLKEGLKVVLDGAITLYKPRGEYQINCFNIQPSGQGALSLAFEQLKQKLSQKGYFEEHIKKSLPNYPKKIALITSATGAALQDMLRVANSRYRVLEIDVFDVLVQGERAAIKIAKAIHYADKKGYDILIVGRGGGSMEDLWAFNEEIVADTIFTANTPIISAVGHEIDWVISDFVADVRAATPSVAMEIALPDTEELYQYLDALSSQMTQILSQNLFNASQELEHISNLYSQHSIEKKLSQKEEEILSLRTIFEQSINYKFQSSQKDVQNIRGRFPYIVDSILNRAKSKLSSLEEILESNNPKLKSKKGFAQISKDNRVIDIATLKKDDIFNLQSDRYIIAAKVIKKHKN
ncbi:MAG: exodeoxyribonuclease VII large subunit [Campylobacterota bacterium]|nr:exodeoxyribonuclease VII large subunit [Campylobacterota bacterium]